MEKYGDKDLKDVKWTKYKIIVPTERDRKELMDAFEEIHNTWEIDTEYVAVNQLAHEYLSEENTGDPQTKNNIIVDKELYKKLNK